MENTENIFDLYCKQIKPYVDVDPHYHTVITLWALHTFVYEKFDYTPRLVIISPIENCGKSAIIDILEVLVASPKVMTSATAANVFRRTNEGKTILLEEFDNVSVSKDLKSVLNDGYKIGRTIDRVKGSESITYKIFAPLAIATNLLENGKVPVPTPTMSRAIIIRIKRALPGIDIPFVNSNDLKLKFEFDALKQKAMLWAENVKLNLYPTMPPEFINRRDANQWRVLFSIADALGRGDAVREVALKIIGDKEENIKVKLLMDIRMIFNKYDYTYVTSDNLTKDLIKAANNSETVYDWTEFQNSGLTKSRMSRMLSGFDAPTVSSRLVSHSIRTPDGVKRGFNKEDFVDAWTRYCTPLTMGLKNVTPLRSNRRKK
jgi:hypothetical protein